MYNNTISCFPRQKIFREYGTPKIHKPGNKVRPIVDFTGTIGYQTSRALADIVSPLVGGTEYHVKNSKHLSESLAEVLIEEDEIIQLSRGRLAFHIHAD